jgi:hypothetical protein
MRINKLVVQRFEKFVQFHAFGVLVVILGSVPALGSMPGPARRVIDLNGVWQVAEGNRDQMPSSFSHTVAVPGLLDMASPPFAEVGKPSTRRQAFWYRREFKVEGHAPAVAILKLHKARYGARVWLNGNDLGEHLTCFTPGYFDVKKHLKGAGSENEIVIRVGANPDCLPSDMPRGWDFEKYLYQPGLYDTVELILTGTPFIKNVQIVPELRTGTARALVEIEGEGSKVKTMIRAEAREAKSTRLAGQAELSPEISPRAGEPRVVEVAVPLREPRVWSPEDPFLYELALSTVGDALTVRFGMRSFHFDPKTGRAVLNGKPYFMRGTNVCIDRFFEDAQRGDRPWRSEWVRRLHQRFKSMHWNSIRYCIGFPPDFWYDIADEEGILIQDEFPIWLLNPRSEHPPESPKAETIIPQYTAWMRERWNHPSVVIWDAQNESFTEETGKAIRAVRGLDHSGRPWDNGWSEPQAATDCVESHPYLFIRGWQGGKPFRLSELAGVSGVPGLNDRQRIQRVPIIINEYCWLWLNRDGSPTCLTEKVYEGILGKRSSVAQRRLIHARYVAALTEFWRCHRECAGVLHFCGLGYSRRGDRPRPEGGATCDDWVDLEALEFDPTFERYVRDAFHPVGVMLDFWDESVRPGEARKFQVVVINDLDRAWNGQVRLVAACQDRGEGPASASIDVRLPAWGQENLEIPFALPTTEGECTIAAELTTPGEEPIRSLRDFKIVASPAPRH